MGAIKAKRLNDATAKVHTFFEVEDGDGTIEVATQDAAATKRFIKVLKKYKVPYDIGLPF